MGLKLKLFKEDYEKPVVEEVPHVVDTTPLPGEDEVKKAPKVEFDTMDIGDLMNI